MSCQVGCVTCDTGNEYDFIFILYRKRVLVRF